MITPKLPDYDIDDWSARPFAERIKMVCQSWAKDGYGVPLGIHIVYTLKIVFFVAMWFFFCAYTPGNTLANFSEWWASPIAFQKAIFWAMLFEGLGLGCGFGPLTARYLPPFGASLYFLTPKTIKRPLIPGIPIFGQDERSWLDVGLYAANVVLLLSMLFAPAISPWQIAGVIGLTALMGLTDKTLFLVHRAEHYISIAICLMFVDDWIAGAKIVWLALWLGAALSKVNHHFPTVISVMISNAPWTGLIGMRERMYQNYPDDLRPSPFADRAAAIGALNEFIIPVILVFGDGGIVTFVGLLVMVVFHLFITSTFPMGVPMEWNVMMIYGGFVLFGVHASVSIWSIGAPLLVGWLLFMHLGVVLYGSFFPRQVSFLLAHRYYAGNWPFTVWLFRGDSVQKLDAHLTKYSPTIPKQLRVLYDEKTITAVMSKIPAFRIMHLLGRSLRELIPRAVDDVEQYHWLDGELVAGIALGWNFGDGHLSDDRMLNSIQKRCRFEEGELRVIMVESQALHRADADWRIFDASTGLIDQGTVQIADLMKGQPWDIDKANH